MVAAIALGLQFAVDLSDIDSDQSGEDDPPSPKGKDTKKKKADRLTSMCFMAHEADEENDNMDEVGCEGLANKWLIDSGCSRHMTGDTKWFASLCKASGDEKTTFGNDAQGCIVAKGTVRVNENCLLKDVALLKATKDIVCAPCRHGKLVSASHPPINLVNTTRPAQLLHMDTVGPARVRSASGKWYVLVIVNDFSRYSWVFFMDHK
uniref:Retrovirus-related Pol polyprotein from transposon TNT 1-94-like beta-barrel domain-containing protein n=1 Tax=Triticum urartu TaxID=4572 RepID=A0A8R7QEA5_TRIUA